MFIVYSPEGQSRVGAAQNLPTLKVEPAKPIHPVGASDSGRLNLLQEYKDKRSKKSDEALSAYESMQQAKRGRRLVVRVAEVMTKPVVTVADNQSIQAAWELMQAHHIKHLPVLFGEQLIGICSEGDLLARLIVSKDGVLEGVKDEVVADVMVSQVVTTVLDTEIRQVALAFSQRHIGCVLIMSEYGKILGIITQGDLIRRLAEEPPIELYI